MPEWITIAVLIGASNGKFMTGLDVDLPHTLIRAWHHPGSDVGVRLAGIVPSKFSKLAFVPGVVTGHSGSGYLRPALGFGYPVWKCLAFNNYTAGTFTQLYGVECGLFRHMKLSSNLFIIKGTRVHDIAIGWRP